MLKRSQTATEYLIILAVVIVIALIVVGILGGIPSIGSGVSASAAKAALASSTIAVENFAVSDYDTDLLIRNNNPNSVIVDKITLNGEECLFFYGTVHRFRPGESKTITCQNVYEISDDKISWLIEIEWTDTDTGASYTQSGSTLALVGSVANEYLSTVQSNQYWNGSSDGCYDNSTSPSIPICTCIDLNKIRNDLTANFTLLNSLDFQRCNEEFGVDFVSGEGWNPIGNNSEPFRGFIDGQNNIIDNLYLSRPSTSNVGLFGSESIPFPADDLTSAEYRNLGLTNVNIEGNQYVGGLVGVAGWSEFDNLFVTGSIIGQSNYVGGVAGSSGGDSSSSFSNIYFIGTLNGSGHVGGITGTTGGFDSVYSQGNIYSSGSSNGGIAGYARGFDNIQNSYSSMIIDSSGDYVGGLIGQGGRSFENSYFAGIVKGANYVAGLVGFTAGSAQISNSYVTGIVNGSGNNVAGLIHFDTGFRSVSNSYFAGTIDCSGLRCGGVTTTDGSHTYTNVYWLNTSDAGACTGDLTNPAPAGDDPSGCNAVTSINQIPIR